MVNGQPYLIFHAKEDGFLTTFTNPTTGLPEQFVRYPNIGYTGGTVYIKELTFKDPANGGELVRLRNDYHDPKIDVNCFRIPASRVSLAVAPPADPRPTADFDGDGDIGTDADIACFFAVLRGEKCGCEQPQ